ncbi:MAG TPA: DUF4328 domain-containing protein [Solirubrobacterales bacterium]|nr:DUF4328 domain-containing protein [Solirubrobacterales bacterium]
MADRSDPPRELSGLAWGVFVTLGIVAILGVVRLLMALRLHSALTGEGNITGAYHTYSIWTGFSIIALLVAAGVFIAWFYRAYKNLRRLGVQNMRYGEGWAIGAWFVPFLNWVRPKQIANDVWRGSERGVDTWWYWRDVEVPGLVHWWWALFLGQGLVVYAGQRMVQSGYHDATSSFGSLSSGLSQMKSGTVIDILGQLVALGAVVLAINVVSQVTQRLDALRAELLAAGPVSPAVPTPPAPAMASYPPPPPPAPPIAPPPAPPIAPVQPAAPIQPLTPMAPPQPALQEQRIQCPECAEWIQPQANVCRFCGHRLEATGQ